MNEEIKDEIATQVQLHAKKMRPQIVLIDAESFEKLKSALWQIDWRSAIASILLTVAIGVTQDLSGQAGAKPAIQSIVESVDPK